MMMVLHSGLSQLKGDFQRVAVFGISFCWRNLNIGYFPICIVGEANI